MHIRRGRRLLSLRRLAQAGISGIALLGLVVAFPAPASAVACTINWTGASGDGLWTTAGNWDLNRLPNSGDWACSPVGTTITLNQSTATVPGTTLLGTLNLSGGALILSSTANNSAIEILNQTYGTLGGPGTVVLGSSGSTSSISGGSQAQAGTTQVAAGATLNLTGSPYIQDGRNLVNNGTVNDTAPYFQSNYSCSVGTTVTNAAGATWNQGLNGSDANLYYGGCGGNNAFVNNGTFNKLGTGNTYSDWAFGNAGTVNVTAGRLQLNNGDHGGTTGGYVVNSTAAPALSFNGGTYNFSAGPGISGSGEVLTNGASITFSAPYAAPRIEVAYGTAIFNAGAGLTSVQGISLSGGTLTLNQPLTVSSFNQSNGTLNGSATATIGGSGGSGTWSGGQQAGPGSLVVATGSTLTITGSPQLADGRSLTNNGTVNNSAPYLQSNYNCSVHITVTNASGATWNQGIGTGDTSLYYGGCGTANRFLNNGTFNKTGAGNTSSDWLFGNSGTVNVSGGRLQLTSGDAGLDSGAFNVSSSAKPALQFTGGSYTLTNPSPFSGPGDVQVNGATLVLNGGTATTAIPSLQLANGTLTLSQPLSASSFSQSGGLLNGSASLTLAGANSSWSGGTQVGPGATVVATGATLAIFGNVSLNDGRVLTNNGTVNNGATYLQTNYNCSVGITVTNAPGATWNQGNGSADSNLYYSGCGGNNAYVNSGTFNKSGTGNSYVDWSFANAGVVNIGAGHLQLNNGDHGTGTGSYQVTSPGALYFTGGTFNLTGTSGLSGTGQVLINGATVTVTAPYGVPAIEQSAGTSTFNSASGLALVHTLNLSGGTMNLSQPATVSSFNQSGGNLGGTGALSLGGSGATGTWSGGNQSGAGTTTVGVGGVLNVSGNVAVQDGRTFINNGTVNDTTQYFQSNYNCSVATVVTNAAGATWNKGAATGDSPFYYGGCNSLNRFVNNGTFNKNGTGLTYIDWQFLNTGTVVVSGGTLQLNNGDAGTDSGTYTVAGPSTLIFQRGNFTLNGGSVSGAGRAWFNGDNVTLSELWQLSSLNQGGGNLTVGTPTSLANLSSINLQYGTMTLNVPATTGTYDQSGGALTGSGALSLTGGISHWSGGSQNGPVTTTIGPAATIQQTNTVYLYDGRNLTNNGTYNQLAGLGTNYNCSAPSTVVNNSGGNWNLGAPAANFDINNGCYYNSNNRLINYGRMTKSNTDTVGIYWTLQQLGTLNVKFGTLYVNGPYSQPSSATFEVGIHGPLAATDFGQMQVTGAATLAGTLAIDTPSDYRPQAGATFPVITYGSRVGNFTTVTGANLGNGAGYSPQYHSGDLTLLVTQLPATTTGLVSSANPSLVSSPVTFTATVSTTSGSATGTVSFRDAGIEVATATLDPTGVASWTTSSLAAGPHVINAAYLGDAGHAPSSSPTINQSIVYSTTTTLSSSGSPSIYGTAVGLSVVVNSAGRVPSGVVTLNDGPTNLATLTLDGSGRASFSTSSLTAGNHSLTATYAGDAYSASGNSAPVVQAVQQASTTSVVSSQANPSNQGAPVTLVATVSPAAGGSPTGMVSFLDGQSVIGSASLSGGTAYLTVSSLAQGNHQISVSYGGDSNFTGSQSATIIQTVRTGSSVTLTSSLNPARLGDSVTFTAVIARASGSAVPTGTVSFLDGGVQLSSVSLDPSGQAQMTSSSLAAGAHTLVARYSGDGVYGSSDSGALTQYVARVGQLTYTGATTGVRGSTVTLSARLTDQSTGAALGGQPVTLSLGSFSGTAVTGTDGVAKLQVLLDQIPGAYTAAADAASSHDLVGAHASAAFSVTWQYVFTDALSGGEVDLDLLTHEYQVVTPAGSSGIVADSTISQVAGAVAITHADPAFSLTATLHPGTGAFAAAGALGTSPFLLGSPH